MKYNEIHHMTQKPEPKPDTYEAGMAQNQLLKIGTHAIKIHNMIDDDAEMEAWVAKKIDLASNYVKSVHGYTAGQKAGTYDDNGMTESREQIGDYAREIKSGKIVRIVDYTDDDEGIYTISYGEDKGENDVTAKDLKFLDQTGGDQEEIGKFGEDADIDANFQSDVLNFLNNKVTQIEQQIESKPALTAEEKENKEFALKLFDFVQKKLEQKDDNTPLEVPKSMIKKEYADNYVESYEWKCKKCGHTNTFGMTQKDVAEYIRSWEEDNPEIVASGEDTGEGALDWQMNVIKDQSGMHQGEPCANCGTIAESINEDAGEGHMSKSQLYATAKMAIELLDMIKKGDDLEGWVQTKLNLAADYLQAVYHYEDYQKLSPYREELDSALVQKHAGVIQKHLDEILSKETETADVDTKPGMMKILKKRVNEVEKEIAKENRKNTDEGDMEQDKSNPIAKPYLNKPEWKALHDMDDKIIHAYLKHKEHKTNESGILYRAGVKKYGKAGMKAIQSAAAKGANHQEIGKIKDRHLKDSEVLDEGKLKDWAKSLAMAGVFVAGLAGVGSIQDAINNSVPAIQAMNTALEMAQDRGDDNLVAQIEKDIKDAKLRLDIGRDLNQVKYLQDKYEKFIATESLAYE